MSQCDNQIKAKAFQTLTFSNTFIEPLTESQSLVFLDTPRRYNTHCCLAQCTEVEKNTSKLASFLKQPGIRFILYDNCSSKRIKQSSKPRPLPQASKAWELVFCSFVSILNRRQLYFSTCGEKAQITSGLELNACEGFSVAPSAVQGESPKLENATLQRYSRNGL